MSAAQTDVLIIGGGLMGAASAFFLRQRGQAPVKPLSMLTEEVSS